jgi:TetR/AcrR family transcriptional regulator, ethionamide resistance regulator
VTRRAEVFDRRAAYHGDRRRAAVLQALDDFLREGEFDTITIADISARAGVTRSAFYFYFENKAAGVAALASEMYRKAIAAAEHLFAEQSPPRQRIQDMINGLFATWEGHQYLYRAMLEASRTSAALREIWDGYRESFVGPVATMIDDERAAGRAPAGPDSTMLATVLLELSDRALERLTAEDPVDTSSRAEVLVSIWFRSIYATTDDGAGPSG